MRQFLYRVSVMCVVRSLVCLLFTVYTGVVSSAGHADHIAISSGKNTWGLPGDLLLFPDVTFISRFDQEPKRKLAHNEIIPEINVFYTFDYGRFRFLGEWLLSTKSHNMERLQFGLNFGESNLWLGRFHNPIGYWNMQYHHAAILQASIARPGIMAFETGGGVIPNHTTGFLFEGLHEFGQHGFYYTVGVGAGPDIRKTGLSAFNIFEPDYAHRPAASFRLGYQPISYGEDEFGISGAYTELPGDRVHYQGIKQAVATLYGNKHFDDFHILAEVVYVNNWLDRFQGGHISNDFVNAYTQLAWDFHPGWTLYGRVEGSLGSRDDPYLAMFPRFVEDRLLGGIRYNINRNMALKLEGSQDHLKNDHFGQMMLQWSAVFP